MRYKLRIEDLLKEKTLEGIKFIYRQPVYPHQVIFQKTKPEFEGDITLLVFPLAKISGKSPEETANKIGTYLLQNFSVVKSFNVVKGFLNLVIQDEYWINYLEKMETGRPEKEDSRQKTREETVMIEFSSPNTNKPLHLGHIRNIMLGNSLANILKATGKKVIRVNLVNDRGIHICKSMLAWKKWGNGETPKSSGMKGDHLVGKYYVLFDQHLKAQVTNSMSQEEIQNVPLMKEAQEMLRKWELQDAETIALWKKMNDWVYEGFAKTYNDLGVEFEKTDYESGTYLLGKKIIMEGLKKNIFYRKDDGSVWVDLSREGLDEKLLLRADGTSVYITQDIGTAVQRFKEFKPDKMIYVVGNEQDHHFKVLFLILKKLMEQKILTGLSENTGSTYFYHLSYGMVDLPGGKMKSREGTVVDADDLIAEMLEKAKQKTMELGKAKELAKDEAEKLYQSIGLAALKYFILKVDPKKRMLFNPEESIDFNGNTGPFIQYTYARIQSVLRKASRNLAEQAGKPVALHPKEKSIIKLLYDFPKIISEAAKQYNPSLVANYAYEVAKEYNQFYQEIPILQAEKEEERKLRLLLSERTANVIKSSLAVLGIDVPERM